jgi:hypothetical protein
MGSWRHEFHRNHQAARMFDLKVVMKGFVQAILLAVFLKYFGLISWARYQAENVVVTTSERSEETFQAPAVTICPAAKNGNPFPGVEFTPEDISAAIKGEFIEILCKDDGEISRCIEEKTFNLSVVKYFTKDGIQGEHISDIQY